MSANAKKDIQDEKELFSRMLEYFQYNFEQEKSKTTHLNNTAKIYLTFQTFSLAAVFLKLNTEEHVAFFFDNLNTKNIILLLSVFLSILSIIISFIYTINELKIRRFERLCNPKDYIDKIDSRQLKTEHRVLSLMIADFAVATDRNYLTNQEKSKCLLKAFYYYIFGIILLIFSWFFSIFNF